VNLKINPEMLILQAAGEPYTGVWTLMRSLNGWFNQQAELQVATGIIAKSAWPKHQRVALETMGIPFFIKKMPSFPGSYALNYSSPAVSQWVQTLHDTYKPKCLVVHFHNAWMSGIYLPIRVKLDCPLTIVATFHGVRYYLNLKDRIKRLFHILIARRLMRYRVMLTSTDRQGMLQAEKNYGIPAKFFHHIPNGLEDRGLAGCPKLTSPSLPFTVGFVGAFDENKGWRLLAEAVERLFLQGRAIKLVMVGDGGPDYPKAVEWAKVRPSYATCTGYVQDAGVKMVPKFDALALPSRQEGMPMVILEAISCGVPVIATAVNAIPDMVRDHYNGFLVDRDPQQIADRIDKLINDPALHATMSANARQIFLENFEISKIAQKYLEIYRGG
jgi:glycosyltransferase involved in cell wall biosynthesis